MVQFKDTFTGKEARNYARAVSSQKCVRAGGKHNDLENVGFSPRHHTFFEMLGSFSFGSMPSSSSSSSSSSLSSLSTSTGGETTSVTSSYGKEQAIEMAMRFITRELGLDPHLDLCVSVLHGDEETASIWRQMGFPSHRIISMDEESNFWSMGDSAGPCGPCTEVYFDMARIDRERFESLSFDDRWLEIWNLVFMQYQRDEHNFMHRMSSISVDTGMGLERIASVMQGKLSNYETDLLENLITHTQNYIEEKLKRRINFTPMSLDSDSIALRIIVDHLRAIAFLIADGVYPSSAGRGYVLRRIIRRAVTFGHRLGLKEPFLFHLIEYVVQQYKHVFPELEKRYNVIRGITEQEEEIFFHTLSKGLQVLERSMKHTKYHYEQNNNIKLDHLSSSSSSSSSSNHASDPIPLTIPGETVFKLYNSYGFPIDLTGLILRDHSENSSSPKLEWQIDEQGYNRLMERRRQEALASWNAEHADGASIPEKVKQWKAEEVFPCFTGYSRTAEEDARIIAVAWDNKKNSTHSSKKETKKQNKSSRDEKSMPKEKEKENDTQTLWISIDPCPFYGEGGGQVGDTGEIVTPSGKTLQVMDTQCPYAEGLSLKIDVRRNELTHELMNELCSGTLVKASVDLVKRERASIHHTATHLVHAALKNVLGSHVNQAGSHVDADRLRFDFTYSKQLSDDQVSQVERMVNDSIHKNISLETHVMAKDEALEKGCEAMFGEKYGDQVRVVKFGEQSMELCGGTHAPNTGMLYPFKITQQSAVAAGTRRVEAVAGRRAVEWLLNQAHVLNQVERSLQAQPGKAVTRSKQVVERSETLWKRVGDLSTRLAQAALNTKPIETTLELEWKSERNDGNTTSHSVCIYDVDPSLVEDVKCIREQANILRQQRPVSIAMVVCGDRVMVTLDPDYHHGLYASHLLRDLLGSMGGRGGGSPTMGEGVCRSRNHEQLMAGIRTWLSHRNVMESK